MFEIDLAKIRKYDKPGPRYTSYPTAPQFNENFKYENYLDEIVKTNYGDNLPDLSLYFHLPYCDTLCYFCGCNMIITRNRIYPLETDFAKSFQKSAMKSIPT